MVGINNPSRLDYQLLLFDYIHSSCSWVNSNDIITSNHDDDGNDEAGNGLGKIRQQLHCLHFSLSHINNALKNPKRVQFLEVTLLGFSYSKKCGKFKTFEHRPAYFCIFFAKNFSFLEPLLCTCHLTFSSTSSRENGEHDVHIR